jgi:DNA-binding LacI/PurR family transcriptional regulator
MRDVARHVGVSQTLVSLVLRNRPGPSEQSRARILQAAAELGYHPDIAAQVLRSNRSRRLGVLFSMQQPYEVDLVQALYPAADRHGYSIVLGAMVPGRDERATIEDLIGARCEAVILIAPSSQRRQLSDLASRLPVIGIGRCLRGTTVDVVRSAGIRGAQLAVDHLAGLGHREIVHIDGGSAPGAADRRRGYHAAMTRHGLGEHTRVLPGAFTEEAGAAAARELLQGGHLPTAVFAANDRCAEGLIYTLVRAGIDLPERISVVGYDDSRTARRSYLDLTTIRQDATEMADLAVEAVAERLERGRTDPREIVIEPSLVIRSSTRDLLPPSH